MNNIYNFSEIIRGASYVVMGLGLPWIGYRVRRMFLAAWLTANPEQKTLTPVQKKQDLYLTILFISLGFKYAVDSLYIYTFPSSLATAGEPFPYILTWTRDYVNTGLALGGAALIIVFAILENRRTKEHDKEKTK